MFYTAVQPLQAQQQFLLLLQSTQLTSARLLLSSVQIRPRLAVALTTGAVSTQKFPMTSVRSRVTSAGTSSMHNPTQLSTTSGQEKSETTKVHSSLSPHVCQTPSPVLTSQLSLPQHLLLLAYLLRSLLALLLQLLSRFAQKQATRFQELVLIPAP